MDFNIQRMFRGIVPFAVAMSLALVSNAQDVVNDDHPDGSAKAYLINGDSVTFSVDPNQMQLIMLGEWSTGSEAEKALSLNFKDPQTVIVGIDGGQQGKGSWTTDGIEIHCTLNSDNNKMPKELSAKIGQAGLDVAGFGTLTKNN